MYNIEACDTAKQALVGLDDIMGMVELKKDGYMKEKSRELKERAVLFMEEIIETGGYFEAVEKGFFVDSALYPERNGDGIARKIDGGVGANTIYERESDYFAPVTAHFGKNNIEQYGLEDPSNAICGCTFESPEKIVYIDELDETDNVNVRMKENESLRNTNMVKPEVEWLGDGIVQVEIMLPAEKRVAEFAAMELGKKMNLKDIEVIHKEVMHPSEGTRIQLKGRLDVTIDLDTLEIPEEPVILSDEEIREAIKLSPVRIVAGTVGEDEHSVGLKEIIDIKHGGIEKYGIDCNYLGTSVSCEKLVDAAIELNADAILMSTIISHDKIHYRNMKLMNDICIEKGIRDKIIIIAGGTQVTPEIAVKQGIDAGFGRGTKGHHVATFLVKKLEEKKNEN
jgi:D-ornithine 4,5-aminomutase subunit beta